MSTPVEFMTNLMDELINIGNDPAMLDKAINKATNGKYADVSAIVSAIHTDMAAATTPNDFLLGCCGINLSNADVGAIDGADCSGGATQTWESVIKETSITDLVTAPASETIGGLFITYPTPNDDAERFINNALHTWWYPTAIERVKNMYGLEFDSNSFVTTMPTMFYQQAASGGGLTLANVSWNYNVSTGIIVSLACNINSHADAWGSINKSDPNGTTPTLSTIAPLDRTICHEMVHAAMATNIAGFPVHLPLWFTEGCADLIVGIDDKRQAAIVDAANSVSVFDAGINNTAGGNPYAAGYILLRYLIKSCGSKSSVPGIEVWEDQVSDGIRYMHGRCTTGKLWPIFEQFIIFAEEDHSEVQAWDLCERPSSDRITLRVALPDAEETTQLDIATLPEVFDWAMLPAGLGLYLSSHATTANASPYSPCAHSYTFPSDFSLSQFNANGGKYPEPGSSSQLDYAGHGPVFIQYYGNTFENDPGSIISASPTTSAAQYAEWQQLLTWAHDVNINGTANAQGSNTSAGTANQPYPLFLIIARTPDLSQVTSMTQAQYEAAFADNIVPNSISDQILSLVESYDNAKVIDISDILLQRIPTVSEFISKYRASDTEYTTDFGDLVTEILRNVAKSRHKEQELFKSRIKTPCFYVTFSDQIVDETYLDKYISDIGIPTGTKLNWGNASDVYFVPDDDIIDNGEFVPVVIHTLYDPNMRFDLQGGSSCRHISDMELVQLPGIDGSAPKWTTKANLVPGKRTMVNYIDGTPVRYKSPDGVITPPVPGTGTPWFVYSSKDAVTYNGIEFFFTKTHYSGSITLLFYSEENSNILPLWQSVSFGMFDTDLTTYKFPLFVAGGTNAISPKKVEYSVPKAKDNGIAWETKSTVGYAYDLNMVSSNAASGLLLYPSMGLHTDLCNFMLLAPDGEWKTICNTIQSVRLAGKSDILFDALTAPPSTKGHVYDTFYRNTQYVEVYDTDDKFKLPVGKIVISADKTSPKEEIGFYGTITKQYMTNENIRSGIIKTDAGVFLCVPHMYDKRLLYIPAVNSGDEYVAAVNAHINWTPRYKLLIKVGATL